MKFVEPKLTNCGNGYTFDYLFVVFAHIFPPPGTTTTAVLALKDEW
jgi:hypothetical protein